MNTWQQFTRPPDIYRPIPFWWWVGETLTKERLAWQLDQIRAKGILSVIVCYNCDADGVTEPGDPPLFSPEWWELFRWVVGDCRQHGMKIGFKDYTIINPAMQEIGRCSPEMAGAGSLRQIVQRVSDGARVELAAVAGSNFLAAWAYPIDAGKLLPESAQELTAFVTDGVLRWQAPAGDWQVVVISVQPHPFDPTHPDAGPKTIEALYGLFERHCPGEIGRTINIIFQDELNFFQHTQLHLPLYSTRIAAEFKKRKGYDPAPWLAALWHDLGPRTDKIRIDYNDVTTALIEEGFFIPIYQWCDQRGVILAHDNHGRGNIVVGQKIYGDYFRTMRWFHAPGTEDPGLKRGDAFKGFKINSSIAHLYGRGHVWNEAFHSSGWGFTPAQIVAGFNEDCASGATLFNLHGLYYTTYGGWWEWAPPDFHFRQPYWEQTAGLSEYIARVNCLLSQGAHQCDVAIVYPITTIEAGRHGAEAEKHAFALGRHLFDAGIDIDYIDFESIERAVAADGQLRVAGECYRVLLFPMMGAVRYSSLEKARDFARAGGTVIFYGCRPQASDRAGSHDPPLDALLQEINGAFIPADYEEVKRLIDARIVRDFIPSLSNVYALHRVIGDDHVYLVFNRDDQPRDAEVFFRAHGPIEQWDAWTGQKTTLHAAAINATGTQVRLRLEPRQAQLIVFRSGPVTVAPITLPPRQSAVISLDGSWDFELKPTLDNRDGDFRRPPSATCIGAEARRFRYHEETPAVANWQVPTFDDSAWPEVTYSFGPRFWHLGPLPPGTDTSAIEQKLRQQTDIDPAVPVIIGSQTLTWQPYRFSLRWGIESDPQPSAGLHGLKKMVPDEFIDLGQHTPGSVYYLWTSLLSDRTQTLPLVMGGRSEYYSWLNGAPAVSQSVALPPGFRTLWNTRHYDSSPQETAVSLHAGINPLLLKFVMPQGQRLRAYVALDPAPPNNDELRSRLFANPHAPVFDYRPDQPQHAGCYRFQSPPGLAALTIHSRGPVQVWVDGRPEKVESIGASQYKVAIRQPVPGSSTIAVRVEQPPDSYEGDSLPEPVQFTCVAGQTALGDWSQIGLACYSGSAWYRKKFKLSADQAQAPSLLLQLGQVACVAAVHLNGQFIANKIAPPWTVELAGHARAGENHLEILVANTLANHYSVGIPTAYVHPHQTLSGLFGPVQIGIYTGA